MKTSCVFFASLLLSLTLVVACDTNPTPPRQATPPSTSATTTNTPKPAETNALENGGEKRNSDIENSGVSDATPAPAKEAGKADRPAERAPSDAELRRTLVELNAKAREKVAAGDYQAAIDPMKEFAKRSPSARAHFQLANTMLMAGKPQESLAVFARSIDVDPSSEPYLWQRGIAQFFAGQFEAGKNQFEFHQTVNSADVENAVWHMLCHAGATDIETARSALIPISGDPRVPMDQIYQLFAGKGTPDQVVNAAKIHPGNRQDRIHTQLYYAHLYVGLFHHMNGDVLQAVSSMKEAERFNTLENGLLMGEIANIYLGQFDAADER